MMTPSLRLAAAPSFVLPAATDGTERQAPRATPPAAPAVSADRAQGTRCRPNNRLLHVKAASAFRNSEMSRGRTS